MLEYKVVPNFSKVAQKVTTAVFTYNGAFQISPKSQQTFGQLLKIIYHKNLSKITQSGHTGWAVDSKTTMIGTLSNAL